MDVSVSWSICSYTFKTRIMKTNTSDVLIQNRQQQPQIELCIYYDAIVDESSRTLPVINISMNHTRRRGNVINKVFSLLRLPSMKKFDLVLSQGMFYKLIIALDNI